MPNHTLLLQPKTTSSIPGPMVVKHAIYDSECNFSESVSERAKERVTYRGAHMATKEGQCEFIDVDHLSN